MLRPTDTEHLESLGLEFEVVPDGGMVCVVLHDWPLPTGYEPAAVDLLLRLPATFPDAQPDMYWCDPPVRVAATHAYPPQADLMENYLGRTWQRFSRHLPAGAWTPGRDDLATYLALIKHALVREVAGT
jgi:hypothetical protein